MSLLELEKISFAYPGHAPVLNEANLIIQPGERVSITGPNGIGKSTMLRIIVGLLFPDSGQVKLDGKVCTSERDFNEMRRRVGMVFQDADDQLFCPTVAEDIAFGPLNLGKSRDEAMGIVNTVLTQLNLMHLRDRVTHKLSGGEKRLVTLATVLAMEPDVLLLDEPTNALDVENEARLVDILNSLPQAIVLVTHNPSFREKVAPKGYTLVAGKLAPI